MSVSEKKTAANQPDVKKASTSKTTATQPAGKKPAAAAARKSGSNPDGNWPFPTGARPQ
jgi:hypothetical protein